MIYCTSMFLPFDMNNIPINDEMDRTEIFSLPMLPTVYACVVGVLFPDIIYLFKLRGRVGRVY